MPSVLPGVGGPVCVGGTLYAEGEMVGDSVNGDGVGCAEGAEGETVGDSVNGDVVGLSVLGLAVGNGVGSCVEQLHPAQLKSMLSRNSHVRLPFR